MGVFAGPDVREDGLVLALDGANYKSFKGSAATNILVGIFHQQTNQNSALYKVTNGTETVYIPSLGYVTSKYVDFYNDYNGGSGVCCPNLFSYGTGLVVSPSTTYTYSIIYKTTTGYSHPNYMYRYEYNGSGGYVTESGVHSTNNRTSLGNDWWFAWGQFTTSATTATLNTYMFHYEYATQNRIYVYKAALYSGSHIIPYQYMLDSGQTRGTTVAAGGGWADLTGNGNNGELANGVRESSDNLGALVFDGTNDFISVTKTSQFDFGISNFAIETFCNLTSKSSSYPCIFGNYSSYGSGAIYFGYEHDSVLSKYSIHVNGTGVLSSSSNVTYNVWTHLTLVRSSGVLYFYINGVLDGTPLNMSSSLNGNGSLITIGKANDGSSAFTHGKIANFKIYNRALSAAEISQNFNANRARFGI